MRLPKAIIGCGASGASEGHGCSDAQSEWLNVPDHQYGWNVNSEGSSDIDVSRLPSGEVSWRRLVDWAAADGDIHESDWIELKSDVDPTTKTGAAKVAKFIIAVANRDVEESARHLGGHAVLLLGVGGGETPGLPAVETLNISRLVDPFLGTDGPHWDVVRIPSDVGHVLAFVVDPPQVGHPMFVARKNGDGIRDGQIYVRVKGASEPNTSAQLDRLLERARPRVKSPQLEVSIEGPVRAYSWDQGMLETRLTAIRSWYLSKLPRKETSIMSPVSPSFRLSAMSGVRGLQEPEDRSEDQYKRAVDDYLARCREAFSELVDQVIGRLAVPVTIRVENMNEQFLRAVELSLHLAGNVEAVSNVDGDSQGGVNVFPVRPRSWGPRMSHFGPTSMMRQIQAYQPGPLRIPNPASWSTFDNTGSIDGKVGFKTIRPRSTVYEETGSVFVIRDGAMSVVDAEWTATVGDVHEVFAGRFELDALPPIDITDELNRTFDLLLPIHEK